MFFIVSVLVLAYICSSKDSNVFISEPMHRIANILNNILLDPLDIVFNPYYLQKNPTRKMFLGLEDEHQEIGHRLQQICIWLSYVYGRKMAAIVANRLVIDEKSSLRRLSGDRYCAYFSCVEVNDLLDQVKLEDKSTHEWV